MSVRGKRKSSFFNQVHLTNFLIEFLGEQEEDDEEKSEEKNVRYRFFFFFLSTREFIPRFDGPLC